MVRGETWDCKKRNNSEKPQSYFASQNMIKNKDKQLKQFQDDFVFCCFYMLKLQ